MYLFGNDILIITVAGMHFAWKLAVPNECGVMSEGTSRGVGRCYWIETAKQKPIYTLDQIQSNQKLFIPSY